MKIFSLYSYFKLNPIILSPYKIYVEDNISIMLHINASFL